MIELLAPAGGLPQLKTALYFGADAVYGGLNHFGLRAFAGNFTKEELQEGIDLLHKAGKKFYLTMNSMLYDDEMDDFVAMAKMVNEMGVDAVIVSDMGGALTLRKEVPSLNVHISTQANTLNAASASFWAEQGIERVVLARELSLDRIKHLRDNTPSALQLEAFVHGAMCMSYSGRCMLSDHLTTRHGNKGQSAQPCRWQYKVVEEKRPNDPMDVFVDERGTNIFSAYDLNMLSHLPQLIDAGIMSLKIEGRMKTPYYVATVISCYKQALTLYLEQGLEAYLSQLPMLQNELLKASHRKSNTGFYFPENKPSTGAEGYEQSMDYMADVLEGTEGEAIIQLKNKISVGDNLEILSPHGSKAFALEFIEDVTTKEMLQMVSVAGKCYRINCPHPVGRGDFVRGQRRSKSTP